MMQVRWKANLFAATFPRNREEDYSGNEFCRERIAARVLNNIYPRSRDVGIAKLRR